MAGLRKYDHNNMTTKKSQEERVGSSVSLGRRFADAKAAAMDCEHDFLSSVPN